VSGIKYDKGKDRISLFPPKALQEVLNIFEMGAKKYEPFNWTKGLSYTRLYDATQRHLAQWWQGEDVDEESGQNHLAHAVTNLLFLLEMRRLHPEHDDRPWKDKDIQHTGQPYQEVVIIRGDED